MKNSFLLRHAWLWLVPLSAVVALLLLEGILRLFPSLLPVEAQQRLLFVNITGSPKSIGDPYLGFTYPPFYRNEMVSSDFRFLIESDEHGFRNSSPWPSTAEIVVVGDSMAYGYGVPKQQSWLTLLDEALPASRVISLGLPGTVPQQYTRYFQRFGVPLHPKLLIYTIFPGNDIIESIDFEKWLVAGSPGNYDAWRFFGGDVPPAGKSILDRSYLVQSLRGVRRAIGSGFTSTTVEPGDGGKLQLVPNQFASTQKVSVPNGPAIDNVVRATLEARARASAIGCQFVVLMIPVKERVYSRLLEHPFQGITKPLQTVLERDHGIAVINATDRMAEIAAQGQTLYFEVDGHPNALGNRVIADIVTQYLRTNEQAMGLDDWKQPDPQSDLALAR